MDDEKLLDDEDRRNARTALACRLLERPLRRGPEYAGTEQLEQARQLLELVLDACLDGGPLSRLTAATTAATTALQKPPSRDEEYVRTVELFVEWALALDHCSDENDSFAPALRDDLRAKLASIEAAEVSAYFRAELAAIDPAFGAQEGDHKDPGVSMEYAQRILEGAREATVANLYPKASKAPPDFGVGSPHRKGKLWPTNARLAAETKAVGQVAQAIVDRGALGRRWDGAGAYKKCQQAISNALNRAKP